MSSVSLKFSKCSSGRNFVGPTSKKLYFPAPQNNEMIRSVVSVDGDDEPIAVDNISVDSAPSSILPVLNEQVWGHWQGTCQVRIQETPLYYQVIYKKNIFLQSV